MGRGIANEIFGFENPIGNSLLVGEDAFRVIGVASYQSGHGRANAPITDDRNHELYVPLSAAKNRMGIVQRIVETGSRQYVRFELSEVIIKFKDQSQVRSASAVIRSLLTKSHPDTKSTTMFKSHWNFSIKPKVKSDCGIWSSVQSPEYRFWSVGSGL